MSRGSVLRIEIFDRAGTDMWVVYANPTDYPGHYVVRRHEWIKEDEETVSRPTLEHYVALTLEDVRRNIPAGFARFDRMPEDEKQIMEVWL